MVRSSHGSELKFELENGICIPPPNFLWTLIFYIKYNFAVVLGVNMYIVIIFIKQFAMHVAVENNDNSKLYLNLINS